MKEPALLWHDNLIMGITVIKGCAAFGVKKLILIGTTCSYPKTPPSIPFKETDLFEGFPEGTNSAYGIAKRALLVGAIAYKQQCGLNFMTIIPTNMYGTGDNFNPETSHVIPAIMLKIKEAIATKQEYVVLWGTGQATRDFLYAQDAAEAICHLSAYEHAVNEPINIGSGTEVSIVAIAEEIKKISGYTGKILWDVSKPDGQPRRVLDISNARKLGWKPRTSLPTGLKNVWDALNA
jgi:GDP-L-fucose synthase